MANIGVGADPNEGGGGHDVVAAFDFDGTLTSRDTSLPFIQYAVGRSATRRALLRSLPGFCVDILAASVAERDSKGSVVGFRGRVWGRIEQDLHERLLGACFGGWPAKRMEEAGEGFFREHLDGFVVADRLAVVTRHREAGHRCVLVTGSLEVYMRGWGENAGFHDVIGTRLEVDSGGTLTGRFAGAGVWGLEKVARLRELIGPLDRVTVHYYGNGDGDRDLLSTVDHPVWWG